MPKFKAGDPVWARSCGAVVPKGEYPGVVKQYLGMFWSFNHQTGSDSGLHPFYEVVVPGRNDAPLNARIYEGALRPRRDDYQQRESRVTEMQLRDDLALQGRYYWPHHVEEPA